MHKHGRHRRAHLLHVDQQRVSTGTETPPSISHAQALRAVGEVIYAARVGDLIKIGYTTNLQLRLLNIKADELLAFTPGTWDDEQQIHRELAIWAAKGREWYHQAPPVIDAVNTMRQTCRLEPLPYVAA